VTKWQITKRRAVDITNENKFKSSNRNLLFPLDDDSMRNEVSTWEAALTSSTVGRNLESSRSESRARLEANTKDFLLVVEQLNAGTS